MYTCKLVIGLPLKLTIPLWTFSASVIILSRKKLKRVSWWEQTALPDSGRRLWPVLLHCKLPFKVDCTGALVVEVLYDLDQAGVNVVKPRTRPTGFVSFMKVVLQYPRLKMCSVVLSPALKPACSSTIIVSAWSSSLFNSTFCMT